MQWLKVSHPTTADLNPYFTPPPQSSPRLLSRDLSHSPKIENRATRRRPAQRAAREYVCWDGFRRRRRPRPPRRGAQVLAQEPPPRARHHPRCYVVSVVQAPLAVLRLGYGCDACLLLFFSGLRGQAGDAAGWVRQPHGVELHRPRQGRSKQKLIPQPSPFRLLFFLGLWR